MSYSFEMAFMSAMDKPEAFAKADQFVKTLMEPENAKKMIHSNLLYFMHYAKLPRGQQPFFQEQIEAAKKLSVKEMARTADLDPADIERNPEYWRRSTIYQKIADVLKLDTWLYSFKETANFERFAMNGINCSDISTELFTRALDLLAKGNYV